MRLKWGIKPSTIDPATFKNARYGLAIDEDEQPIKSWSYVIVRHDQSSRPYHVWVRIHGRTLAVMTAYATLKAAKTAALTDAGARWDIERAESA